MLITIAAVGVFVIIFTVFIIHFLKLRRQRRQAGTPATAQLQALQFMLDQLVEHWQALNHLEQVKSGLDPSAIAALPTFPYSRGSGGLAVDCTVCLATVEEEETVRALPNCIHVFHAQCIDKWLHYHSTCPICRFNAGPLAGGMDDSGADYV